MASFSSCPLTTDFKAAEPEKSNKRCSFINPAKSDLTKDHTLHKVTEM